MRKISDIITQYTEIHNGVSVIRKEDAIKMIEEIVTEVVEHIGRNPNYYIHIGEDGLAHTEWMRIKELKDSICKQH